MADIGGFPKLNRFDCYHWITHSGFGSTNTAIPYFGSLIINDSSGVIKMENSTVFGLSFTANVDCYVIMDIGHHYNHGITLNSSQLTTSITGITASTIVSYIATPTATCAVTRACIRLKPRDVLRPHSSLSAPGNSNFARAQVLAWEIV